MKPTDQIKLLIRQRLDLSEDHPIQDHQPLYSFGASPLEEVLIIEVLAAHFEISFRDLLAEALVGSNVQSHTVPFLFQSIMEVLANDSTTSSQPTDQDSSFTIPTASSGTGRDERSPDAAASGSQQPDSWEHRLRS